MPRYVIERTFPTGLAIPINDDVAVVIDKVNSANAQEDVTWIHSYVSDDRTRTFCVYDGPSPEAIRSAAERNSLPVDRITAVTVLDANPYR